MLQVLKRNLPLKIFSVILAFFLWMIISRGSGGETMEISLGIPVELHNLPPDLEVIEGPVERVNVRISGPRRVVSRISQKGITMPLDLTGVVQGNTTFELYTDDILVPESATVTRISPSAIDIVLEKILVKSVTVEPVVQGSPGEGYQAGAPTVSPEKVKIRGLKGIVSRITRVRTSPISIQDAVETVRVKTSLAIPDPQVQPEGEGTVTVTVPITGVGEEEAEKKDLTKADK